MLVVAMVLLWFRFALHQYVASSGDVFMKDNLLCTKFHESAAFGKFGELTLKSVCLASESFLLVFKLLMGDF